MSTSVELSIPDDLLVSMSEAEIKALAQEAFIVRLYELGRIGSGRAAQLLGHSRRDFLQEILGRYGVSSFDEEPELAVEAACG